jgi:hypothetical protein
MKNLCCEWSYWGNYRQISGYMHGPDREMGQDVPEDSKGRVTELTETTATRLNITKWNSSGSEQLYQSIV